MMDWLFISILQGPVGLTVDNSRIGVVWQCSNFVEGIVYADNLTIRANHIASLRKIFKKQLALSFSVRVVPCI